MYIMYLIWCIIKAIIIQKIIRPSVHVCSLQKSPRHIAVTMLNTTQLQDKSIMTFCQIQSFAVYLKILYNFTTTLDLRHVAILWTLFQLVHFFIKAVEFPWPPQLYRFIVGNIFTALNEHKPLPRLMLNTVLTL